jgi:hypothetical protein
MNSKQLFLAIVILALIIPAGVTTQCLVTVSDSGSTASIPERWQTVTAANTPGEVTVVVDISRVRTMTVPKENPEFYFSIIINGENAIWWEEIHKGFDIFFEWPTAAMTLPFNEDNSVIPIQIEVWEKNRLGIDQPFDASGASSPYLAGKTITIFYDMKRGEWTGDDYLGDSSGYGHISGFEDENINESDCELWFDIYQITDEYWWHETDRLTAWEKEHIYGLNATQNYYNTDFNADGIPIEWEDKYGFDPFADDATAGEDPDQDGLTNFEEFKTAHWLSDPFTQDIFIEVDGMEAKNPLGSPYTFPQQSQQLLLNAFARHNIVVHIDDGTMGGGGDLIPFDEGMDGRELIAARLKYFLNGNEEYWKRGVFHYAVICHQMEWSGRPAGGRMCYIDMHTIGGQYVRNWAPLFYAQGSNYYRGFASVFMHELGHTLGLNAFEGVDNENSRFPWNEEYWEWGPYKSCMNYRYVYKLVDYSIGDDADHDQNDWDVIDLTRFTQPGW